MKVWSILLSSFREVLWMDADNLAAVDPSIIFDAEAYTSTGALFWPDYCNMFEMLQQYDTHTHTLRFTSRGETWRIFDIDHESLPRMWPSLPDGETATWAPACDYGRQLDFETGASRTLSST